MWKSKITFINWIKCDLSFFLQRTWLQECNIFLTGHFLEAVPAEHARRIEHSFFLRSAMKWAFQRYHFTVDWKGTYAVKSDFYDCFQSFKVRKLFLVFKVVSKESFSWNFILKNFQGIQRKKLHLKKLLFLIYEVSLKWVSFHQGFISASDADFSGIRSSLQEVFCCWLLLLCFKYGKTLWQNLIKYWTIRFLMTGFFHTSSLTMTFQK